MDFAVTFLVLDSKTEVTKHFESYYKCRLFVNKLKHSKRCVLLSYPNFYD